jgi:hypothetical protein
MLSCVISSTQAETSTKPFGELLVKIALRKRPVQLAGGGLKKPMPKSDGEVAPRAVAVAVAIGPAREVLTREAQSRHASLREDCQL